MKTNNIFAVVLLAAMATACTGNKELKSGINLANLDSTYQVGADFYMYATGGWQKANPLTAEYSRYGSFDVLRENNIKQLQEIIDSVSTLKNLQPGSIEQKIADLYNSAMDSVELNENSGFALEGFLLCDGYQCEPKITEDWLRDVWPRMQRQGVPGLFRYWIVNIMQGGLTLGQKDYYVENDEATAKIREAYKKYIVDLCMHDGFSEKDAQRIMQDVMRIETRIAVASKSMTELRDPEANYNKFTYDELKSQFSGIDWDNFFGVYGIKKGEVKNVIVGQPDAIHEVEKILKEEKPEALQNIYLWHAMDMTASYIDDEARAIAFAFSGTVMSGKTEDRPRWKRAVESVEDGLGEALGQLYVARFFPPAAKKRMEKLIRNLQIALGERIDVQDWMSDETKKVAREKLDAFYVKVGYPDKWKDYSSLEIGKCYLDNMLAINEWAIKDMIKTKLNKPVDKDEWFMTPQTVNAYYNPTTNEICFPAGILQPPFFDMTWWNEEDTKRFEERISVMREFHNKIEVLPGLYANGSLTLGENMADHGGLMVSFQAFKNATADAPLKDVDGFTPEQRFFLAYANVWAQNIRDEEIRKRVKSDPHQLGQWRVNGQLPHLDAWYEAFGITEKDPMFVPKENRVTIW